MHGLLAAALAGAWSLDAQSTLLTFDQKRESGIIVPTEDGGDVPQDYGDRVAGPTQLASGGTFTYGEAGEGYTPNVVAEYFSIGIAGNDASLWGADYGDLVNVLFGDQFSNTLNVRLTADPGFSALLYGFDLAGWRNADYVINGVRVLAGAVALFEQTDVLVQGNFVGPRHTSFAFDTPLSAAELLIQIDYGNLGGTIQDNIGIDNIRFGQFPPPEIIDDPGPGDDDGDGGDGGGGGHAVPEPSTVLLLGIALLGWTVNRNAARRA